MKYGIKVEIINDIKRVFFEFENIEQVILYRSRAKGTYKNGSDIDLTIKGNNIDLSTLNKVANRLDDLLLPYTFDLSIFSQIKNNGLIDHINRVGAVFYQRKSC